MILHCEYEEGPFSAFYIWNLGRDYCVGGRVEGFYEARVCDKGVYLIFWLFLHFCAVCKKIYINEI